MKNESVYIAEEFHNPFWGLRSPENRENFKGALPFTSYQSAVNFYTEKHGKCFGQRRRVVEGTCIHTLEFGDRWKVNIRLAEVIS